MKCKIIKGTTHCGKIVNEGDVLDLDERDYALFVKINKDAEPYTEPPPAKTPEVVAVTEAFDAKKGKK